MERKVTSGTISVGIEGSDDELRQLANWLRDEDDLRGRVRLVDRAPQPGHMGSALDTIEVLATSGTATALVTSVFGWLRHRRSAERVTLRVREAELTCGSADDAAMLMDKLHGLLGED
jgi:hypothetical protein